MEATAVRAPRAVLFDAYGTLFDVYSAGIAAERWFPGAGERLALVWRVKRIEYTRLSSMSGRPRSFRHCTRAGFAFRRQAPGAGARLADSHRAHLRGDHDVPAVNDAACSASLQTVMELDVHEAAGRERQDMAGLSRPQTGFSFPVSCRSPVPVGPQETLAVILSDWF